MIKTKKRPKKTKKSLQWTSKFRPALRYGDDVRLREEMTIIPKPPRRERYKAWYEKKVVSTMKYLRANFERFDAKICVKTLIGHQSVVSSVCVSPDSVYIATGSHDKTIRIWLIKKRYKCKCILIGHKKEVMEVKVSHCSKFIASASWDKTVRLWTFINGRCIHIFRGHRKKVLTVDFSDDTSLLASGDMNSKVILWNVDNYINPRKRKKKEIAHIYDRGQNGFIYCVRFSPNGGHFLATAAGDYTIRLYTGKVWFTNSSKREHLVTFVSHWGPVTSLAFSPDTKLRVLKDGKGNTKYVYEGLLVSGGGDSNIKIWRLGLIKSPRAPFAPINKVETKKGVLSAAIKRLEEVQSLDDDEWHEEATNIDISRRIHQNERPVSSSGRVSNINVLEMRPQLQKSRPNTSYSFLKNRSRPNTSYSFPKNRSRPNTSYSFLKNRSRPNTSQTISSGYQNQTNKSFKFSQQLPDFDFSSINRYRPDAQKNRKQKALGTYNRPFTAPVLSRNNHNISNYKKMSPSVSSDNKKVNFESKKDSQRKHVHQDHFPGRAGELIYTAQNVHKDFILGLSWSYDGSLIASSGHDKSMKLFDARSGKKIFELADIPAHEEAVSCVCFFPNSKKTVTTGWDGKAKVWTTTPPGFDSFASFYNGTRKRHNNNSV